ncbi:MAG: response regulator transcription factor [bacterium]|nr:response regulator transcription factor [bacterium]
MPGAPASGIGKKEKYNRLIFDKYNFSQREQEITSLVVEGKTNKVIADELFLSFYTVRNHVSNIYKKVGVKSRVELVNFFTPTSNGDSPDKV